MKPAPLEEGQKVEIFDEFGKLMWESNEPEDHSTKHVREKLLTFKDGTFTIRRWRVGRMRWEIHQKIGNTWGILASEGLHWPVDTPKLSGMESAPPLMGVRRVN